MRDETRRAWIEALRSGLYVQTRNKWRTTSPADRNPYSPTASYCCLQVLSEVVLKADPLAGPTAAAVELTAEQRSNFIDLNDEAHFDFNQIADEIENDPSLTEETPSLIEERPTHQQILEHLNASFALSRREAQSNA